MITRKVGSFGKSNKLKFLDCKPLCLQNFAFDKLELESSPLTVAILERNRTDVCWQVFVDGSGKFGGISKPIGYLKGLVHNFFLFFAPKIVWSNLDVWGIL